MNFFFFKQKTAYEMRISDWSSDVCSSDLGKFEGAMDGTQPARAVDAGHHVHTDRRRCPVAGGGAPNRCGAGFGAGAVAGGDRSPCGDSGQGEDAEGVATRAGVGAGRAAGAVRRAERGRSWIVVGAGAGAEI